jgi:glutathione S-transferase
VDDAFHDSLIAPRGSRAHVGADVRELYADETDFSPSARLRCASAPSLRGTVVSEIILHHYPGSPFAEKARIALGIKGLPWLSVIIPMIMPKPDLMPLTGGYRKTPVMQIGADIYCDTQCILREIERRYAEPSLYRGTDEGTANALAFYIDRNLFTPAVGLVFGGRPEMLQAGFREDREQMTGRPIDLARIQAAKPVLIEQLRPHLRWFEMMLEDGRTYLMGAHPTLVDCALYNPCWFIRDNLGANAEPLTEFPRLQSWLERMEKIGHGAPTPLSSQQALAVAQSASPQAQSRADANDPFGRKPGMKVQVTPDDIGRDPVIGELLASSPHEIVIRRSDPQVGEVAIHFPRAGFIVRPATV